MGDTRTYDGVVVKDSALNAAQLPVLEWFLDDTGYNELLQTVCDQVVYTGVITWQGKVYDNSTFRVVATPRATTPSRRSRCSCPRATPSTSARSPGSNAVPFSGPLDEWALQNESYPVPGLGWQNIAAVGDPVVGYLPVRSQHNATFFGTGAILEEYDGSWRDRKGYDAGASTRSRPAASAPTRPPPSSPPRGDFTRRTPTTATTPTSGS